MKPIKIGIYLYELAEVLDFSGPFEVFTTAADCKTPPMLHIQLLGGFQTGCRL